jgi:hypothetical protein
MAEPAPPSGALADLLRLVGPYIPHAAGALMGMFLASKLTFRGRLLALAVGIVAAVFGTPMVVFLVEHFVFGGEPLREELKGFFGFTSGCFGMAFLSGAVQAVARYASDPLSLVRIEYKGVTITGGIKQGENP